MKNGYWIWVLAVLGVASFDSTAFNPKIASAGLPSAASYSATLLPDLQGVVSWKTLAQSEPAEPGAEAPEPLSRFSRQQLALDQQSVRIQGFILPLDLGEKQKHFLVSAVPPHCPFCMPAGPDAIVEVYAKEPVEYQLEPVIFFGKLTLLKNDPAGLLYRMSDAKAVATQFRPNSGD